MLVPAAEEVGQAQDDVSIPTEPSTSKPYKKNKSKKQQPKEPKVPSPTHSLEHQLPSPSNDPIPTAKDSLTLQELMDICIRLSNKVMDLESELIDLKSYFTYKIAKLKDRNMEKSFKQERMIEDMDEDVKEAHAKAYNLDFKHVEKVVTTAQATTTAAQVPKPSAPRRRRGVVIQDPKETATSVIMHSEVQAKDKGKGILIQEPKPLKVIRYQALKRKLMTEAQARKNMMIYLKNMAGFKMDFFKGMTYSEIRPIFEMHYNSIQAFLEKVEEEVTIQEEEELKRHLQIVANDDDDVFIEATPLASKLVKERFETTEPKNFSDDFLLNTLKIMFEKPNIKANVWRDQKGRYRLAKVKSWKLFESFRVHVITLTTTQMSLLVEKKYPLTHFTLQQMLDNIKLEVEEESEMSLELLRLVKRQLNEGPEHPPSPDYVPGPEHPPSPVYTHIPLRPYLEVLQIGIRSQCYREQALSSGYVADSDPNKDPEENPEEDHADYPADGMDGDDEPSDDDDEEASEDEDDDEEEHLALADSLAVPVVDPVPSAGDIETFETDELKPPMSTSMEARIAEHAAAPTPQLLVSSQALPLPSPLSNSPADAGAPLVYRAAGIRMRALLPSTSYRTDIPEAEMPPQKRAFFITPAFRLEGVNQRVIELATTIRQDTEEFQVRFKDAQDDRAFLGTRVNILFRDRRFLRHTIMLLDREARYARRAWTSFEDRNAAIEAHVRTLKEHVATLITQTLSLQTQLTTTIGRIETPEARDLELEDEPAKAGSSYYVVDSYLEKDEKDPKEDPADYPADRGNNDDDESSNDDDDDDVEKDERKRRRRST
nr:hypothetical protein [Tanacetum cinerariifolium]